MIFEVELELVHMRYSVQQFCGDTDNVSGAFTSELVSV